MAESKAGRYRGAQELNADVARYLDGRRVEAFPEGPIQKAARLCGRHKIAFGLIVAYLAVRASVPFSPDDEGVAAAG